MYSSRYQWLQDRSEDLAGVIVTHGHEDHLGVPHLLKQFEVPLYGLNSHGPCSTKGNRSKIGGPTSFHVVSDGQRFQGWAVRSRGAANYPFCSSKPLCCLAYPTRGDSPHRRLQIDREPIDGRITDIERLKELREGGVRLLMADSTNADKPGGVRHQSQLLVTPCDNSSKVGRPTPHYQLLR